MIRCLIVCLTFVLSARAYEIGMIGDALAVENPCGNYLITVERLIGGPPNREEYWDGTVNLQNFKNLTDVVITLYLSASANVTVDDKDGKLLTDDNPYNITFFKQKDETYNAKFHVQPTGDQEFPILSGLLLNDENICPNTQMIPASNNKEDNENPGNVLISDHAQSLPECGTYFTSASIDEAKNWPWNAVIYYNESDNSNFRCSGVYIAPFYVLTTGHCISESGVPLDSNHLSVDIPYLTDKFQVGMSSIKSVKLHENFTESNFDADIAIVEVSFDLSATSSIQPVCLWEKSSPNENGLIDSDALLIAGNAKDRTIYRKKVTFAPIDQCLVTEENNLDSVLCGKYDEDLELCDEMQGSGLFFKKGDVFYLSGLLSSQQGKFAGVNCSKKSHSTFIDVGEFIDWIRGKML